MNRTLALILTAIAAALLMIWAASAMAQANATLPVTCLPARFFDAAMESKGMAPVMHGAFNDGDALVVYADAARNFVSGFRDPKRGHVCLIGWGSGLEISDFKPGRDG